jgi:hypothetical protein
VKVITVGDMLRGEGFAEVADRYDDVEFDRCPLAYVGGDPVCIEPRRLPWLDRAYGAARGVSAGIGLALYEPSPTGALLDAVAALKMEGEAAASWDARMRE